MKKLAIAMLVISNAFAVSQEKESSLSDTIATKVSRVVENSKHTSAETSNTSKAIKAAIPAVVSITTVSEVSSPFLNDPLFGFFFSYGQQQRVLRGGGSGFIVDPRGYVVTCAHVVNRAKVISVTLANVGTFRAEVIQSDASLDLAVLKLKLGKYRGTLPHLNIAEDTVELGDKVIAIGNPFGIGPSATQGIVSARYRLLEGRIVFQTDAAVNPGNSGGPILTKYGTIAGTASAIYSRTGSFSGIGFFVPSIAVKYMVERAINKTEEAKPPFQVTSLDPSVVLALNDRGLSVHGGCEVARVLDQSIEIQTHDIVLSIAGRPTTSKEMFEFFCKILPVGERYQITYIKANNLTSDDIPTIHSAFVMAKSKTITNAKKQQGQPLQGNHVLKGVSVADITPELAAQLELSLPQGVVVLAAPEGSVVRKSDVIVKYNDRNIDSVRTLQEELDSAPEHAYSIAIQRGGAFMVMSRTM
jgi:S1-C subfamily serine protease